jgi:segregation and condensation protein A
MRGDIERATLSGFCSPREPMNDTPEEDNNDAISAWEEPVAAGAFDEEDSLIVDVAGFEGPLDLLLALARTQKVDIAKISVLALVDQYLVFVAAAQKLKLELAADYLVMAAWLAFLKSRLLLPRETSGAEDVSAEEMARRLSFRLMRLDAMREAAAQLMTRSRLGREVFQRGMPEGAKTIRETTYSATVYDLLHAYADQRRRTIKVGHVVKARTVWSIKDARERLERIMGDVGAETDWIAFERYLESLLAASEDGKTVLASSFGATLELAREGRLEIRQDGPFAPIYMRPKRPDAEWQRVL